MFKKNVLVIVDTNTAAVLGPAPHHSHPPHRPPPRTLTASFCEVTEAGDNIAVNHCSALDPPSPVVAQTSFPHHCPAPFLSTLHP